MNRYDWPVPLALPGSPEDIAAGAEWARGMSDYDLRGQLMLSEMSLHREDSIATQLEIIDLLAEHQRRRDRKLKRVVTSNYEHTGFECGAI